MSVNTELYEVFYQDLQEETPDSDIVFSLDEAQMAVIDFYNEIIAEQFPKTEHLKTYTDAEAFKALHPKLIQNCWFQKVIPSNETSTTDCQKNITPDFSTDLVAAKLQELLQSENIFINLIKLQPLLEEAIKEAQKPTVDQFPSPSETPNPNTNDSVWLVHIAEDDIALYEEENYIDSASKTSQNEMKEIISSAQMLAERNKTEVQLHYFKKFKKNWTWADVDKILIKSGLISSKNNLLPLLKGASIIKVDGVITQDIKFYDSAYQDYISLGEDKAGLVKFKLNKSGHKYNAYLTVKEVINAIEVKPNQWICADLGATQLEFNVAHQTNPKDETDTSLS